MRTTAVAIAAALALTTLTASTAAAKPANIKQAKDAGVQDVKCGTCHSGSKPPTKETFKEAELTPAGKFVLEQKAKKNVKEVDGSWLKEYTGPK